MELKAADTILDRGVRFTMPAPFLIRLLRLNRIRVKPLRSGAILEFSRVVLRHKLHDLNSEATFDQMVKNIEPLAECLAIAVLNNEFKIKWFTGIYTRWFLWRCHYIQLMEMFAVLSKLNQAHDFTIITKFFCQQTTSMMSPRNLGQQANGE